jgi:hypothetical protein
MAQQTFISRIENAEGKMVDFNRWSFKRPEAVVKKYSEAIKKDPDFWRLIWRDGVTLAIYATPDGYSMEKKPCYTVNLNKLFDKIKVDPAT